MQFGAGKTMVLLGDNTLYDEHFKYTHCSPTGFSPENAPKIDMINYMLLGISPEDLENPNYFRKSQKKEGVYELIDIPNQQMLLRFCGISAGRYYFREYGLQSKECDLKGLMALANKGPNEVGEQTRLYVIPIQDDDPINTYNMNEHGEINDADMEVINKAFQTTKYKDALRSYKA